MTSASAPLKYVSETHQAAKDQFGLLTGLMTGHGLDLFQKAAQAQLAMLQTANALVPRLMTDSAPKAVAAYAKDFGERAVLFQDVQRQRAESATQREADGLKPVLAFEYEIIVDGSTLARAVNYSLVRVLPPDGCMPSRDDGRPWVIIDPRAGHGSGIGGFKSESEVGVALEDGHPVYFVVFYPEPMDGQTLADVTAAEARFLQEVAKRHPHSPRPLVTGNCQGGWAAMILAATHPDLTGPLVIAGAPLSYWAGQVGTNPFRYYGGLAGGAVPALLTSDLGGGRFDGANLVMNFEQLNPGKTWWRKNYDLFTDQPGGAERYLDFERWWSGFYFMNRAEIAWIVENLFIGNKLTKGQAVLDDGTPVDLSHITAPVVVFASHGDNITPPQQALNWIPDLYDSVEELRARGHIIIYTLHESVGHLGIFVSAKVASTQHRQITSVVKTIEALAPGLYEMQISSEDGAYSVDFASREMADILALGGDRHEEREFAAVSQFSDLAVKAYDLTLAPMLRAAVSPDMGKAMRAWHPMRWQQAYWKIPFATAGVDVDALRATRDRAQDDNVFVAAERAAADIIETSWDLYRDTRDAWLEIAFHSIWAAPPFMTLAEAAPKTATAHDIRHFPEVERMLEHIEQGGYPEAIVRMLVLLARARGSVRRERLERSNAVLHARAPFSSMDETVRSHLIHEQTMIVDLARAQAIEALPKLLKDDVDRLRALDLVLEVAGPVDEMDAPTIAMFEHLQTVLRMVAKGWSRPEAVAE